MKNLKEYPGYSRLTISGIKTVITHRTKVFHIREVPKTLKAEKGDYETEYREVFVDGLSECGKYLMARRPRCMRYVTGCESIFIKS